MHAGIATARKKKYSKRSLFKALYCADSHTFCIRKPATEGVRNLVTPSVEACAL